MSWHFLWIPYEMVGMLAHHCAVVMNFAPSAKSVGGLSLGKSSNCLIKSDFDAVAHAKSGGSSGAGSDFVVEAIHGTAALDRLPVLGTRYIGTGSCAPSIRAIFFTASRRPRMACSLQASRNPAAQADLAVKLPPGWTKTDECIAEASFWTGSSAVPAPG